MLRKDLVSSVFYTALAAYVCWQGINLGIGSFRKPGPGLFPFLSGSILGLLAISVFFRSLLAKGIDIEINTLSGINTWKPLLLTFGSLFGFALCIRTLGFNLTTFLFLTVLLRIVEKKSWMITITAALSITLGAYIIFDLILQSQLPKGVLGF